MKSVGTEYSDRATQHPEWLPAARIAGDKDWTGYMGGDPTAGEPLMCMLHHRAAPLVGHPKLPQRARVVITFPQPFAPAGPSEEQWKQIDQVINSAERRIVQRKLGLLVLLVVHPRTCEVLLYCTESQTTRAALEAARDRAAAEIAVDVSVEEDPQWQAFHAIWSKHGVPDVAIGPAATTPVMKELAPRHPATASNEAFRKWVRKHPPRCVGSLRLTWMVKVKPISRVTVGFRLSHKTAGDVARVHAHRLDRIDASAVGDARVSPIHVTWKKLPEPQQLFDAASDGYQGEFGWNSQPRGSGVGPPIACTKCGGEWFRVAAIFAYHDPAFELGRDQPSIDVQNYFAEAIFRCTCVKCDYTFDV